MALNTFKCNYVTQLLFKGLNCKPTLNSQVLIIQLRVLKIRTEVQLYVPSHISLTSFHPDPNNNKTKIEIMNLQVQALHLHTQIQCRTLPLKNQHFIKETHFSKNYSTVIFAIYILL